MGKYISARAALAGVAGVAAITLAGCGSAASTTGAASTGSPAASASATVSGGASASATTSADATASSAGTTGASVPFPVAVGNTWIYQAVTSVNNAHSLDTKKIMAVTPTTGGREVTMADALTPGAGTGTVTQKYLFYDNGQIGFPISTSHGVTVVSGNGIVWPNAADLAAGKTSHSTSTIKLTSGQLETADVTVSGGGTQSVTVSAGTYQATLVNMTIVTHVGSFTTTITVKEWAAPGVGPVKSEEIIKAAGQGQETSTETLLSFKKG
jgi:hypothetical protein